MEDWQGAVCLWTGRPGKQLRKITVFNSFANLYYPPQLVTSSIFCTILLLWRWKKRQQTLSQHTHTHTDTLTNTLRCGRPWAFKTGAFLLQSLRIQFETTLAWKHHGILVRHVILVRFYEPIFNDRLETIFFSDWKQSHIFLLHYM